MELTIQARETEEGAVGALRFKLPGEPWQGLNFGAVDLSGLLREILAHVRHLPKLEDVSH